jgi:hypothetical protein
MDRSTSRNAAFLCGAAGAATGVFGSSFVALLLARAAFPEATIAYLNWLVPIWLVLLIVLILGLWPALDYLLNHRPMAGTLASAGVGLSMQALGITAIVRGDPSAFVAWFAAAGGLLLLLGGLLGRTGGGTDPLTWETLRTPRIVKLEGWLDVLVDALQLFAVALFAGMLLLEARLLEAALTVAGSASLWFVLWRLPALKRPGRPIREGQAAAVAVMSRGSSTRHSEPSGRHRDRPGTPKQVRKTHRQRRRRPRPAGLIASVPADTSLGRSLGEPLRSAGPVQYRPDEPTTLRRS